MNREKVKNDIKQNEGCINHLYLDTNGNVTIAVGQLVSSANDAKKLILHVRDSGEPASEQQIVQEYDNVIAQKKGMVAANYKAFTSLEMRDEDIDTLLDQRIEGFVCDLQQKLGAFEQFPSPAQEALLDMAFNLGANGLTRKFPKLIRAANEQDWQTCAVECKRLGISEQRNQSTQALFQTAKNS